MSDPRQQPIPGMRQPDAPALATEADAVARLASRAFEPRVVDLTRGGPDAAPVLLVPAGMELKSIKGFLDQYLPRPVRRAGTTLLHDLPSFIAAVTRVRGESSAIYLDTSKGTATAIIDHDEAGEDGEATARWQGHRLAVTITHSVAWREWGRVHGGSMSQGDFAAFIDDRLPDIIDRAALEAASPDNPLLALMQTMGIEPAGAAQILETSRGLRLRADVNVTERVSPTTGESELIYAEAHNAADGTVLRVPTAFLIALPVFDGAPRDVMLVRLRYRRVQGQPRVNWTATVYQREDVLAQALRELADHIAEKTGCTVYLGEAPAPAKT